MWENVSVLFLKWQFWLWGQKCQEKDQIPLCVFQQLLFAFLSIPTSNSQKSNFFSRSSKNFFVARPSLRPLSSLSLSPVKAKTFFPPPPTHNAISRLCHRIPNQKTIKIIPFFFQPAPSTPTCARAPPAASPPRERRVSTGRGQSCAWPKW